jgi:3-oxoacyl-[acyl-carrier protein] reductase
MPNLLTGKKVLVTGAGRGIGVAIALELAREGAEVALLYRNSRTLAEETATQIRQSGGIAFCVQADLLDETQTKQSCDEAIQQLGGLDILIANAAGFGPATPLDQSDWAAIADEFEAVVKPVVTPTKAVLPTLLAQGSGSLIYLTATMLHRPAVGFGAHAMAKAAVLAYARTLAKELGPSHIRVNAVAPGMAMTEFSHSLPPKRMEAVRNATPLRTLAEPEDVARLVVLLCTPLAGILTGAELAADGGLAMPL